MKPGPGYRWALVGALGLTEMISWGVLYYGYAIFMRPMQLELHLSRTQVSGAFSLGLAVSGVAAVPVGRWLDRHGSRGLMTVGSVASAALCLAWSRVTSIAALYIVWIGLGASMAAVIYEPAFAAVAGWFRQDRRTAFADLTVLAGMAGVVFIPLSAWLTVTHGWRHAVAFDALMLATTIPIHASMLPPPPDGDASALLPTMEKAPAERSLLRDRTLQTLALSFTLSYTATVAIGTHLIALLTERGHDARSSALAMASVELIALPARVLFARLAARASLEKLTGLMMALQAAGICALAVSHFRAAVWIYVALFGIGFGTMTPARAMLLADLFPLHRYGRVSGYLAVFLAGSRAVGPVTAGALRDLTGSYTAVLVMLTLGCAIGAMALWRLGRKRALPLHEKPK